MVIRQKEGYLPLEHSANCEKQQTSLGREQHDEIMMQYESA